MADIIITGIIIICIILILFYRRKRKKSGKHGCCSDCNACIQDKCTDNSENRETKIVTDQLNSNQDIVNYQILLDKIPPIEYSNYDCLCRD